MRHILLSTTEFEAKKANFVTISAPKAGRKYTTYSATEKCYRCFGTGHYGNCGTCWECNGNKVTPVEIKVESDADHEAREAKEAEATQQREAQQRAEAVADAKNKLEQWTLRLDNCNKKHGCESCDTCQHGSYCNWRVTVQSNIDWYKDIINY